MPDYTIEDFLNYVKCFLGRENIINNSVTMDEMQAALKNAQTCIDDYNEGIDYFVERKNGFEL